MEHRTDSTFGIAYALQGDDRVPTSTTAELYSSGILLNVQWSSGYYGVSIGTTASSVARRSLNNPAGGAYQTDGGIYPMPDGSIEARGSTNRNFAAGVWTVIVFW